MRLLIVNDDIIAANSMARGLEDLFYQTLVASSAKEALRSIHNERLDGIVIEQCNFAYNDTVLLKEIRQSGLTVPVIIISSHSAYKERVCALDAGADDYLVRPVEILELDARLNAVARRSPVIVDPKLLRAGLIEINLRKHRVIYNNRELFLQPLEYRVIVELVTQADKVVSRDELYKVIWGYDDPPKSNIIDGHILRLRNKLSAVGGKELIETVRGVGYSIRCS